MPEVKLLIDDQPGRHFEILGLNEWLRRLDSSYLHLPLNGVAVVLQLLSAMPFPSHAKGSWPVPDQACT